MSRALSPLPVHDLGYVHDKQKYPIGIAMRGGDTEPIKQNAPPQNRSLETSPNDDVRFKELVDVALQSYRHAGITKA